MTHTDFALAEAQEGLWYAQRLDPDNPLFNTGQYLRMRGPLNVSRFTDAVNQTVREADALALAFRESKGDVRQFVDESRRPWLQIIDVSSEADPEVAAMAQIMADTNNPTDPLTSALAVEQLFVLAPDHHLWYQRVHHLVIDGYGMTLLNNRVAQLYNQALQQQTDDQRQDSASQAFSALAAVFSDGEDYRNSSRRGDNAAYWREQLSGMPEVTGMVAGKAVSAHRFERAALQVPPALQRRVRERADAAGVPWPDLLTALNAAYCQRFAGSAEMVVGVPYMGRLGNVSARVPAMVMNVLPLRICADANKSVDDFLIEVSRATLKARRHGRYRSEQMRRDLGLLGGHRRLYGPLINILPFDKPVTLNGLQATTQVLSTGPVDDITFTFRGEASLNENSASLLLEVDANPQLYSPEDVEAHGQRLLVFLERVVNAQQLAEVPLATDAEAEHFINTVNRTTHEVPDTTLTALIESAMLRYADNAALVFDQQQLDYAALERRSRALALQLREQGLGRGDIVAICLPRSLELVIALLAVLRAGAAYLPLDLEHPAERVQKILRSAGPKCVLCHPDYQGPLASAAQTLPVPDWTLDAGDTPLDDLRSEPGDLAYVIYTSGSTGEPKGVMIEHRAIVNRLQWMRQHYGFDSSDRILQKTPATFDVSVWEFFLPFISGATLAVAPPDAHRDPRALVQLIRRHNITTLHFVPSMLAVFVQEPSAKGLHIRRVFCSGEELGTELGARFHQTVTAQLHNLYGPTEAAVDVSYWPVTAGDATRPIPIGFPVWNTRLYILDDQLRPVPAGVTGHLYLAGVQLARGYLGRPDLTEARFVADPFVTGERMYLTGDLARWRGDGAVEYLGRSDHQVKIRGLRIELGEIEAAVMASGLVRQAGVLVREDAAGNKRLVAYLVPATQYTSAALKTFLQAQLPDYMVPVVFVELDALPTTSNGKLDRSALPQPEMNEQSGRAPATPTEKVLAELYVKLLGLAEADISADSDFFSLGGDSLLAVQLMQRINQHWGRDPGLGALFDQPGIEGLARLIDAAEPVFDSGLQPLLRLATGDEQLAPLFVIHPVGGISWCYRQLANGLNPRRTVYGLQAPSLDPDVALPPTLQQLAADYVDRIRSLYPHGPVHLAGWSVGGIIAQAMAVELQGRGQQVGVVALFDAYPSECWRAEAEPTSAQTMQALLAVAGYIPEEHPELVTREAIVAFLREGDSPLGALPDVILDGVIRAISDMNALVRGHYHQPYNGTLTHFRAALDHQDSDLVPQLWQAHAGSLDVMDVPFMHSQLTGAAASAMIAQALAARMQVMDKPFPVDEGG